MKKLAANRNGVGISLENLAIRDAMLRAVRDFFHARGYLEVETPVRIAAPAQETHIDAPPAGNAWLRASPELQMKRLLMAGCTRIFQIGPCFRANECGRRHNPEFTMLEWYCAQADYNDILADTRELLLAVCRRVKGATSFVYQGETIDLEAPWPRLAVGEAYRRWAGWDPVADWQPDRFDLDMIEKIEPALPRGSPCVLSDYPAPAASLARLQAADSRLAERWELYMGGLELANAYSELCEAETQRDRFAAAAEERRALGRQVYPLDEEFLEELAAGMPPCGGIALGLDRLAMLLCDSADIAAVRLFCERPGRLL